MTLIAFLPVLLRLSAQHHRAAVRRRHPLSAGRRGAALVGVRHGVPGAGRHQAAGACSSATSASRRPTARNWSMARTMPSRATRRPSRELFANVRRNYFRLYFHYMYFNVARYLLPAGRQRLRLRDPRRRPSSAGKITLGADEPDPATRSSRSRSSFQYLVNSWTTIVELLVDLQAPARLRGDAGGCAAADDRPPISGRPQPGDGEGVSRVAGAADALCTSCPHPARCEMVFSTV